MSDTKSQGCTLALSDGASPEVYSTVASVTGFQLTGASRSVLDGTTLASTAKEKVAGLLDNGQLSINYKFQASDTVLVDLWDAFLAGGNHNFQLTLSDSPQTVYSCTGFLVGMPIDGSTDALVTGSATIELNTISDNLA